MTSDYSISGINDTASSQNKVDLHMVDTFAAVIREFSSGAKRSKKGAIWSCRKDIDFLFLHLQLRVGPSRGISFRQR
jgi:hypothetical protein